MNLDEFQPYVASQIAEHRDIKFAGLRVFDPDSPNDGTGIIVYRGSYPKVDGRETALDTLGLCIIVDVFTSEALQDSTQAAASHAVNISVMVEENVKRNTSGFPCERVAQFVAEAVIGKPGKLAGKGFRLASVPFEHMGQVNGLTQVMVNFTVRQTINAFSE